MCTMPANSLHTAVFSPPYNLRHRSFAAMLSTICIEIDPNYVAAARRRLGQVVKEAAD
jgi:hypothetical protein